MRKQMKRVLSLIAAIACAAGAAAQYNGYTLVWSDDFNGGYANADATTGLDLDSWNFETGNGSGGWGTGQRDYATTDKANVEVSDGTLKIRTRRNYAGQSNEYTSGRLNTKDKRSFLYGKVEARIRTDNMTEAGRGFAFWMMPNGVPAGLTSVTWPQGGEIDIFEYNGLYPEYNLGSVHYCWGWNNNQWAGNGQHAQASNVYYETDRSLKFNSAGRDGCTGNNSMTTAKNNLLGSSWHVYGINWYSDRIEFFVRPDGSTVDDVYHVFYLNNESWCGDYSSNALGNVQCATGWAYEKSGYNEYWRPFENPFYVILSAGVGGSGTYGGDITAGNNPNQWTCTTEIDWVRCYKLDSANPPEITLSCAAAGSSVQVTPALKSGGAIAKIEYVLDKVPVASTATAAPFTYTFTPTATTHKIYARACNAQGYWGEWVSARYVAGASGDSDDCLNNFMAYTSSRYTNCDASWNCNGAEGGITSYSGATATCAVTDAYANTFAVFSGIDQAVKSGVTYVFSGKVKATNDSKATLCVENRSDTDVKMFASNTLALPAGTETPFSLEATATSDFTYPDLALSISGGPANTTYTITDVVFKPKDCSDSDSGDGESGDECANQFAALGNVGSICCDASWNCPGIADYGGTASASANSLTFNYATVPANAFITATGSGEGLVSGTKYTLSGTITATVGATVSVYLEQNDDNKNTLFSGSISKTVTAGTPVSFSATATASADMTVPKLVVKLSNQPVGTYTVSNLSLKPATCPTTEVESVKAAPVCRLYPNPARDYVYVDCEGAERVLVYALDGQLLLSEEASGDHAEVPVSGLSRGVYLVRVFTSGSGVIDSKMVKR